MNTGAFGEGFPYTNFHDLNMDWIIKIAKDFLDQYTHIQEIIEQGKTDINNLTESGLTQLEETTNEYLSDLETKKNNLEALLQAWYDTHSNDIATQLASALASIASTLSSAITTFNSNVDTKTAQAIASIPSDYTELANTVLSMTNEFDDIVRRISGSGINVYQGAIAVTGDDAGKPTINSNRLYTQPIHYRDYIKLKSGYQFYYSVKYVNGEFDSYNVDNIQGTTIYALGDPDFTHEYRLVITKTDATQPILPTDDIFDVVRVTYSDEVVPSIKEMSDNTEIYTRLINCRMNGNEYLRTDGSTSVLVSVKPGEHITFKPGNGTSYFIMVKTYTDFDEYADYATGYSSYGLQVTDMVDAIVPEDANYLIVLRNVGGTSDRLPEEINVNGININKNMVDNLMDFVKRLNKVDERTNIKTLIQNGSGYTAGALKWLAIGDSFTEINDLNDATIKNFIKKGYLTRVVEEIPQLEYTNIGTSGLTLVDWATPTRLNMIVSGYDLYTVMLGTNDWSLNTDWGTIEDFTNRTNYTALGSLGKIIDRIHYVAPNAKLVVLNQFHRTVGIVPGGTQISARNHDTYLPNAGGNYFADLMNDIIECCKLEDVDYVDIFNESNVTPRNCCKYAYVNVEGTLTYLRYPEYLNYIVYDQTITNPYNANTVWVTYDGVHPAEIGMKIIAKLLIEKLREILFS